MKAWTWALPLSCLIGSMIAGCGEGPTGAGAGPTGAAGGPSAAAGSASAGVPAAAPVVLATHPVGEGDAGEVTALGVADGKIYVGTRQGLVLMAYDPATRKIAPAGELPGPPRPVKARITAITVDAGRALIASEDGWAGIGGEALEFEDMGEVTSIAGGAGKIFAGRNSGVEERLGRDWSPLAIGEDVKNRTSAQRVRCMDVSKDNMLWVGTEFGLLVYDIAGKKWGPQYYGDYQNITEFNQVVNEHGNCNLAGNLIHAIACDRQSGKVYVGTQFGLSIVDGQAFSSLTGDHTLLGDNHATIPVKGSAPLPSAQITCVLPVADQVLAGTPKGLARIAGQTVTSVGTDIGLPSAAITALAQDPKTGVVFVGTEAGLAALSVGK